MSVSGNLRLRVGGAVGLALACGFWGVGTTSDEDAEPSEWVGPHFGMALRAPAGGSPKFLKKAFLSFSGKRSNRGMPGGIDKGAMPGRRGWGSAAFESGVFWWIGTTSDADAAPTELEMAFVFLGDRRGHGCDETLYI